MSVTAFTRVAWGGVVPGNCVTMQGAEGDFYPDPTDKYGMYPIYKDKSVSECEKICESSPGCLAFTRYETGQPIQLNDGTIANSYCVNAYRTLYTGNR